MKTLRFSIGQLDAAQAFRLMLRDEGLEFSEGVGAQGVIIFDVKAPEKRSVMRLTEEWKVAVAKIFESVVNGVEL